MILTPMTNIECLTDIMTFSRYGALAQTFVMDALSRHAERVAMVPISELEEQFSNYPMINAQAWQGVAREIHNKLEAHFAS
jgi:hypothetical protein